jgi:hypothetical protein
MSVTVDDFAKHLGYAATPADTVAMQRCLDSAVALIAPYLVPPPIDPLPPYSVAVLDLATLTVAGDLWRRKDSPGGVYGFADGADYPTTLPRDPLVSVWAWLVEARLVNGSVVA